MIGAFAQVGSRDRLLGDLSAGEAEAGNLIVSKAVPSDQELKDFADATGLAPRFVLLVRSIHEGDLYFVRQLVAEIPQGADTRTFPRRWLARVWNEIGRRHDDETLLQATATVIDLHERVDAGEDVPSADWRKARSLFRSLSSDTAAAGNVVAAAAWDPRVVPGGIADVVFAWHDYARLRTEIDLGWTEEHAEEERAHNDAVIAQAHAMAGAAGEEPQWIHSDEGRAWEARFFANLNTLQEHRPPSLPDLPTAWSEARERLVATAKSLLLDTVAH